MKTTESMYGDVVVDLSDHEDLDHGAGSGLGSSPDTQHAGIRPSDSWLDVSQGPRKGGGMHVTFQVQAGLLACFALLNLHAGPLPEWEC